MDNISNKGTGAGGANTNYHGKKFENETDFLDKLISIGFKKEKKLHIKKFNTEDVIIFVTQSGLKGLLSKKFGIKLFRNPDEAYLIFKDGKYTLKILEKKEQNREGSVETKLWAGPSLKREYQIVCGDEIQVEYAFCLSPFLKNKMLSGKEKYNILSQILKENNIDVFFGKDEDYFDKLNHWIHN